MMSETEIYRHLEAHRFTSRVEAPFGEIALRLEPQDLHTWTSPDFLLWLTVEFPLAGQQVVVKHPIPIEAEKAGWRAAMPDLVKLAGRREHLIETAFLVIGDGGYHVHAVQHDLPANVTIRQIPDRDLRTCP